MAKKIMAMKSIKDEYNDNRIKYKEVYNFYHLFYFITFLRQKSAFTNSLCYVFY